MKPFARNFNTIGMTNLMDMKDLQNLKILLIDDEPLMRTTIPMALRAIERSFVISVAEDGETALRLIEEIKPELVVCDINMEPMNGLQVVDRLRNHANPALRDISVIMLTGRADEEAIQSADRLKVQGYLVKPVSAQQFAHVLYAIAPGRDPKAAGGSSF